MKRYIINLMLAVAATACLTSCNDFLKEDPSSQIKEDEAYKNETELYLNAVAALYNNVGGHNDSEGLQGTARGVYDLNEFTTDEAILPTRGADWYDGGLWQNLFRHSWGTGTDCIGDTWKYLFKSIIMCNSALEHIDAYAKAHGQSDNTAYWRYEARALRAMFYFYAIDLYGRLPLYSTSHPTVAQMQLQERSTVYKHIVDELQDCAAHLTGERSNWQGKYYGRINAATCYFLLAKLMLNAEVYSDDDWTDGVRPSGSNIYFNIDGRQLNAWQATEHYCDLIAGMGYRLEDDYTANFAVHNEKSRENIFVIPMDKYLYQNQFKYLFRSRHYNHAAALGLNGENGSSATIEAMKTFGYGTDTADARLAMSYYCDQVRDLNGRMVTLDDGTPLKYYPMAVKLDLSGDPHEKTAGARMKKYEVDPTGTKDGNQSDNDIVLFRYADVLLMRAEALAQQNKTAEAIALVNQIRSRAATSTQMISNYPSRYGVKLYCKNYTGSYSKEQTMKIVKMERRLELAMESERFLDLVRWGEAATVLNAYYAVEKSKCNIYEEAKFTPNKNEYLPIPYQQVSAANGNYKQNCGNW